MVGMREERRRGIRMGGLGADGGDNQRSFSHPVYHEKGAQYQGQEGEDCLRPRERENGKRHGEDGQKEVPSRDLSDFTSLEIPPQIADGISRGACGQRPHKE